MMKPNQEDKCFYCQATFTCGLYPIKLICDHEICQTCMGEGDTDVPCTACASLDNLMAFVDSGSNIAPEDPGVFQNLFDPKMLQLPTEEKVTLAPNPSGESLVVDAVELQNYKSWKKNSARCFVCKNEVAHSQLFVCRNAKCNHTLTQSLSYRSPQHFFNCEKVSCGSCSFLGLHKNHPENLESALMHAIEIASTEVSNVIDEEMKNLASLDMNVLMDFVIAKDMKKDRLPVIQFLPYLKGSKTVEEWDQRYSEILEIKKLMDNNRKECQRLVSQMAAASLSEYQRVYETIKLAVGSKNCEYFEAPKMREEISGFAKKTPPQDLRQSAFPSPPAENSDDKPKVSAPSTLKLPPKVVKKSVNDFQKANIPILGGYRAESSSSFNIDVTRPKIIRVTETQMYPCTDKSYEEKVLKPHFSQSTAKLDAAQVEESDW